MGDFTVSLGRCDTQQPEPAVVINVLKCNSANTVKLPQADHKGLSTQMDIYRLRDEGPAQGTPPVF